MFCTTQLTKTLQRGKSWYEELLWKLMENHLKLGKLKVYNIYNMLLTLVLVSLMGMTVAICHKNICILLANDVMLSSI